MRATSEAETMDCLRRYLQKAVMYTREVMTDSGYAKDTSGKDPLVLIGATFMRNRFYCPNCHKLAGVHIGKSVM